MDCNCSILFHNYDINSCMLLVDDIITVTNVWHVTNMLDLFHIIEIDFHEMFKGDEILAIIWTCEHGNTDLVKL